MVVAAFLALHRNRAANRLLAVLVEWLGEAWLEESSGTPVRVQFRTSRRFEEDDATITNLSGSVVYHRGGPEEWYPREVRYTMDIDARVFPLMRFRGRVETTLTLRDYFLLD